MDKENFLITQSENEITVKPTEKVDIVAYEQTIKGFLAYNGLPVNNVFTAVDQRAIVFKNVDTTLQILETDYRRDAIYISKFIAAVSAGLFDAALNYLWNETINELRHRVSQYDISFFYDTAINSPDKRKNLRDENDLDKISDSELIHGSKEIGLISDIGFKHLDYIKYMRNWASAAHPNQSEISGLQLISWLETCINEVISLPLSEVTVEIKKLLSNVRTNSISEEDAKKIALFFDNLKSDQVNILLSGFFGMYTRKDSSVQLRDNVKRISPYLWAFADEENKSRIGIKYGKYIANNDKEEEELAREFLEIVDGLSYIPEKLRIAEIDTAIDELLIAHRGTNNFYSEPMYAKELQRLIGDERQIVNSTSLREKYVHALVEVFLSNGHGVAWNAESVYEQMLRNLEAREALLAILSIHAPEIEMKLQYTLCLLQYKKLIEILKPKITSKPAIELIELIQEFKPLNKINSDQRFRKLSQPLFDIVRVSVK